MGAGHAACRVARAGDGAADGDQGEPRAQHIAQTPGLHYIFIDMLFVGLSDNTRLESYVSLYKTHNHAKMSPTTIEAMFLYHAGLELERLQLRSSEMRSMMGGALGTVARQRALDSKPLRCHHHASKKQQSELCRLALARAKSYDRARYFRRGATGLLRIYATEAATQASFRDSSAKRKAVAQIATCHVTEGGKRRRPAPPPYRRPRHTGICSTRCMSRMRRLRRSEAQATGTQHSQ